MEARVLEAVLAEMIQELPGKRVTSVKLLGAFGILVYFDGVRRTLLVSVQPELPRLGLVERVPGFAAPREAPDNLSKPLRGARLEGSEQEKGGRVAAFRFGGSASEHKAPRLICELIPRFANAILLGETERILWAKRTFEGERPRRIAPGALYQPPAAEATTPFRNLDRETLLARLAGGEGPVSQRLPRGWGGGSGGHAEVFEEAGLDAVAGIVALFQASRPPVPTLLRRRETGELHLFPGSPGSLPGWELVPGKDANETADLFYRAREEEGEAHALLGELRRILARRRARAAKALSKIEERAAEADREQHIRRQAELLAANLAKVHRGMREVRLTDFDGSTEVVVELDPAQGPRANLDRLFRKARRLLRGRDELESQRVIQIEELARAERVLAELEVPLAGSRLTELVEVWAPALLHPREGRELGAAAAPEKRSRGTLPEGFNPRRYELGLGWEVWVGKSSKQNDELTHRWARGHDLWFHARGCEGSHTVLRVDSGKGEPPREIVLKAAAIAAYHSKARNSRIVPVAYTEKRYVRKPRGAPVGTAAMMREKVVMVEPWVPEPGGG